MIRALFYIIKVGLLVAAAVWLADRPGSVNIDWMEYHFKIHLGFFLVLFLITILLAIFIYRLMRALADLPKTYRRYRHMTDKEKGYRALALGLTAVAAGDARAAGVQAKRAVKLLPQDKGMPLLLQAQAERLRGNETAAQDIFAEMLENKDTAFLGVRGLLQGAIDSGNTLLALELARRGLKLYPKQKWLLELAYDLEIRSHNWLGARAMLERAVKAGAMDEARARSERVAMLMVEAEALQHVGMLHKAAVKLKQVYKMDPFFVPGVLALAHRYLMDGQRRKAVKLVEKSWAKQDHAALAALWLELADAKHSGDALARLKWAEKLLGAQPESIEAHLVIARAAMEASLWGEARGHLEKAGLDSRVFKLRAEIEKHSSNDDGEALFWLEKASAAPGPREWVCGETGRVYAAWSPIATPHGAFNTITWDFPQVRVGASLPVFTGGDTLLEALRI